MNDRMMIAMSGGVDSAVAAHLCARDGGSAGVTMQHFTGCDPRDARDAAAICAQLGIEHYVAHLEDAFYHEVILPFISAYERGETPNPCVICNQRIKFGALLNFAMANGFDRLATGHYARIEQEGGRYLLRTARDGSKDQTYMLYTLSQDVLSRVAFPLGAYSKEEVRDMARTLGFAAADRADSQDICFVPDGDYAAYISKITGKVPPAGDFVDMQGKFLGKHRGQLHYTIGQRKGLGISLGAPAYVISKSAELGTVTLGRNEDLYTTRLVARSINLITEDALTAPRSLFAKVRYSQRVARARVEQTGADELTVEFEVPQRAVCAGQSVVLYEDDYVVGGGIIA